MVIGISPDLIKAFMVYLIGHNRSIAELLAPRIKPLAESYENEFKGMTFDTVELSELEEVLPRLVKTLMGKLSDQDKAFLLSFKEGKPNWDHLGLPHVEQLPSVQWKLFNLDKMSKDKRKIAIAKLERILQGG